MILTLIMISFRNLASDAAESITLPVEAGIRPRQDETTISCQSKPSVPVKNSLRAGAKQIAVLIILVRTDGANNCPANQQKTE